MTDGNSGPYEHEDQSVRQLGGAHPEESRACFRIQAGEKFSGEFNLRTTPAGIVSAGISVTSVILSLVLLARATHHLADDHS